MRKRTRAREFALQILYRLDIGDEEYESVLENFWLEYGREDVGTELKDFTTALVKGAVTNRRAIDKKISGHATNWQLERMAVIDRNILRMGCFELLFCKDIPPKVSINEAVELAKKYSEPEAGKFVNAILDKVKIEEKR